MFTDHGALSQTDVRPSGGQQISEQEMLPPPSKAFGAFEVKPPPRRDSLPVRSGYPFSKPIATSSGRVTALRSYTTPPQGLLEPSAHHDQGASDCLTGSEYVRILTTLEAAKDHDNGTELTQITAVDHGDLESCSANTHKDSAPDTEILPRVSCNRDGRDIHTLKRTTRTGGQDSSCTLSSGPLDVMKSDYRENATQDYQSPGHDVLPLIDAHKNASDKEEPNAPEDREQGHDENDPRDVIFLPQFYHRYI